MRKVNDYLVIAVFSASLLSTIALIAYSVYAVAQGGNINAATSIIIACVCLALAVTTAKQFRS